ncbi:MAG: T9SS type A sorting domain-containing protein [Candidatus Zixiibacteriota bacterium]
MKRVVWLAIFFVLCAGGVRSEIPRDPVSTFHWSRFNAITTVDSFIVAAGRDGLMVFSLGSTDVNLTSRAQAYLDTEPMQMLRSDSVLVVITRAHIVYFIDLRALPQIHVLGELDLGVSFTSLSFKGSNLYLTRGFDGLFCYHLDSYNSAHITDSSLLGIHDLKSQISGDTLFVLDDYNGVLYFRINDAGTMQFLDYLFLPFQVTSFVKQDSIITLVSGRFKLFGAKIRSSGSVVTDSIKTLINPRQVLSDRGLVYLVDSGGLIIQPYDPHERIIGLASIKIRPDTNCFGDFVTVGSSRYLGFAMAEGGIGFYPADSLFDGIFIPQFGLRERGLITSLAMTTGKLFVGSDLNPLNQYRMQPDGTPVFEKTVFGALDNVSSMDLHGDSLFITFPQIRRSVTLRVLPDTNVYQGALFVDTLFFRACRFNPTKIDTLRSAFLLGQSKIGMYAISDSGAVTDAGSFDVIGRITDIELVDSLIAVCTGKGVWLYRIYDDFSVEFRFTLPAGDETREIMKIGSKLAIFSGNLLLGADLTDLSQPIIDTMAILPWAISGATRDGRLVYAIGERGICILDVSGEKPVIVDAGGRGGTLIAAENGLVATSDSNTVRIYDLTTYPTGVNDDRPVVPRAFALDQNYPNPFNPSTVISYSLATRSHVRLSIYNLLGQRVATLVDQDQAAGNYHTTWEPLHQASGVYLYRLEAGQIAESKKMILLK